MTANRFGSMTFATQSVVRYLIAIDLCARLRLFYFTPALLVRRLCCQSGSSRDLSPVSCVTSTVTMRYTMMVVRVSGSRKPLFKFANYLMTGQTRTRPLQFSTDQLVSDRVCVPFQIEEEREMSFARKRCHRTLIVQGDRALFRSSDANICKKKNFAIEQSQARNP